MGNVEEESTEHGKHLIRDQLLVLLTWTCFDWMYLVCAPPNTTVFGGSSSPPRTQQPQPTTQKDGILAPSPMWLRGSKTLQSPTTSAAQSALVKDSHRYWKCTNTYNPLGKVASYPLHRMVHLTYYTSTRTHCMNFKSHLYSSPG